MKPISDLLKRFSAKIEKIAWILGLHAFLLILLLILIDCLLASLIFYKYVFLPETQAAKTQGSIVKFDYKTYQKVLGNLQPREQSKQEL